LQARISKMDQEQSLAQGNLAQQMQTNLNQKTQIEHLQKKINGFSKNQSEVSKFESDAFQLVEKSRFKASGYMTEINQREEELGRVRSNLIDAGEENKGLTVTREKMRKQNEFLAKELKTMEETFAQQKRKMEEQQRLIDNLTMTSKVHNASLKDAAGGSEGGMMQKAQEEALKNERIAAGVNRSTFLHLGEKKKTLVSETESSLLRRQKAPTTVSIPDLTPLQTRSGNSAMSTAYMTEAQRRDQVYITDDAVPSLIFPLIESYRQKVINQALSGQPSALIIDDFFGEAHAILKDTHLKEIARIRNENNVDVMKLKKSLEERLVVEGGLQPKHAAGQFDNGGGRARRNHAAGQQANLFADNEAERQRR
jgi:hypothetical protein